MRHSRLALLMLLVGVLLAASPVQAQDRPRIAITSLDEVDADFALQGEYEGYLSGQGQVGLQVVALGLGEFQAVLYPGGLPGSGWSGADRVRYSGRRVGDTLLLNGDAGSIEIRGQRAAIRTVDGATMGRLMKIRRISPTLGAAPRPGATVLFGDGQVNGLVNAKVVESDLLDVGFTTAGKVQDFQMHVEFRTPYMPNSRGQQRGNSGVYIQRRYEVQVLDSFGLDGVANECAGLYRQKAPDVNMCLPPLSWQTYDIFFRAARWADGKKVEPARITVLHNGVAVQNNYTLKTKTGAGRPEGPEPGEILFQNHRDPVRFRNLWIISAETEPAAAHPPVTARYSHLIQPPRVYSPGAHGLAPTAPLCPPKRWLRR